MLLAQLVLGYDDLEPMTRAACAGDIIEIERLLDLGFPLDRGGPDGQTPLLYAAANGKTTAVRMMLERGADVGVVTTNGQTVLHLASSVVDDPELTRLLLDYNAPLNTRQTALDLTPLDLARLSRARRWRRAEAGVPSRARPRFEAITQRIIIKLLRDVLEHRRSRCGRGDDICREQVGLWRARATLEHLCLDRPAAPLHCERGHAVHRFVRDQRLARCLARREAVGLRRLGLEHPGLALGPQHLLRRPRRLDAPSSRRERSLKPRRVSGNNADPSA